MSKIVYPFVLASIGLGLVAGCSNSTGGSAATAGAPAPAAEGPATYTIAVIPKGTTDEYWKSIHAGADKAAADLSVKGANVQVLWKGALREDDRNGQIDVVQTFINRRVNAIALAPVDADALARPANSAVAAGIPVVVFDSGLHSHKPASFVATDNYKGGSLGADTLAKLMGGKGSVIMMRCIPGSASTAAREAGFLAGIAKYPQIKILSSNQYGGATADTAYNTAENLLARFGGSIQGVFVPSEPTTRGMLHALKNNALLNHVQFVGFDASPDLVDALAANQIQGLVVQNPYKMGYTSVATAVAVLEGKHPPTNIDTGAAMVTPANMNTPAMQQLLHPPVE